tara:strand:+ start:206 stop:511 length:306 start_codon:yes stop_codon:yes gene_type:complete
MIFLFLLSCIAGKSSINFNPTDSMCLDATVANMHSAGCKVVSVEKTVYGVTRVYCYEADRGFDSQWITHEFFAIAFGTKIPDDAKPICTDPFLIMTAAEKD